MPISWADRPFDQALWDQIIEDVASGALVADACDRAKVHGMSAHAWRLADPKRTQQWELARTASADILARKAAEITAQRHASDSEERRAKRMAGHMLWRAACASPNYQGTAAYRKDVALRVTRDVRAAVARDLMHLRDAGTSALDRRVAPHPIARMLAER